MEKEKTQAELLREKLCFEKEHFSVAMTEDECKKADEFCEGYKDFLATAKTERECVNLTVAMAKEAGYRDLEEVLNEPV